jgi:hypothetical protein
MANHGHPFFISRRSLKFCDLNYWLKMLFKVADGRMIFRAFSASGR